VIETGGGRVRDVILTDGRRIACDVSRQRSRSGGRAHRGACRSGTAGRAAQAHVFVVDCPDAPRRIRSSPIRRACGYGRKGQAFITGYSPPESEDVAADPDDFEPTTTSSKKSWPALAARIPPSNGSR
jgi:hypothetical protein